MSMDPRRDSDQTASRQVETSEPASLVGTVIAGRYKLRQEIGEGGMGSVYLAEQTQPVKRQVALKLVKPGMDSRTVLARFESERQALALLDHPHIAKVFDAGTTDTGRPFFVMELVKGIPLTEFCDQHRLGVPDRLALFRQICSAVQHAHQKGIIHRDLKPTNILVESHDGQPVPKVIDFGLAKATSGLQLSEHSVFTAFGTVAGTPLYMAPEQAVFNALDVDTRADIYALGVILYEILTGSTPIRRETFRQAAIEEMLRLIREVEPPTPSSRISTSDTLPSIAATRQIEPAKLSRFVRGDLDWIVMKALAKERNRRYESAIALAQDIERFSNHEPVTAGPPGAAYRFRKFARRHRVALVTGGAFAVFLVAAAAVGTSLAIWADRQRVRAVSAERLAEEEQARAQEREQMAIDAVRRYGDVVGENRELKTNPGLAKLRATLLNEPQAFFQRLRDRLQADRETTPRSLARLAEATYALGYITNEIGDKEEALRAFEESLRIREKLATENRSDAALQSDLAASHYSVGMLLGLTGRPVEGLASCELARTIIEPLARQNPSDTQRQKELARYCNGIGLLESKTGRLAEALESHERTREIQEQLCRENPAATDNRSALAGSYKNIGLIQIEMGSLSEAAASYQKAHAIWEGLARENPGVIEFEGDLAGSDYAIGALENRTGQPARSLESYKRARAIQEKLVSENPAVTEFQQQLVLTLNGIGVRERESGRPAEALEALEQARGIEERLARDNPTVTNFQRYLAGSHLNIGMLHSQRGRPADAIASLEKARAIFERLARENPSVTDFGRDLASAHSNIGGIKIGTGQLAEALRSLEEARAILERLVRAHPESADFAGELGGTLHNIAAIDLQQRQFDKARAGFMEAITRQRKALEVNPRNPTYRLFLGNHLTGLIQAAQALGRTDLAEGARRELAGLTASDPVKAALDARLSAVLEGRESPKNDAERIQLALRAYEKSLHAASARLFREALANDPKLAGDRQAQHAYNAACAAALAGTGHGKEDTPPDEAAKAKLRGQAREWLKAELAAWSKVLDGGTAETRSVVTQVLKHWKSDADLAGIRDGIEMAKLPETERAACKQLWKDVDQVLARAGGGK